jgi:hypothetical protein
MAARLDFTIDQGATFTTTIELTDQNDVEFDLELYTGSGQIRKNYESNTYTAFTVTLDDANAEMTISLTPEQTANLKAGRYVYDVEFVDDLNNVIRVIEGVVTVSPQVTR